MSQIKAADFLQELGLLMKKGVHRQKAAAMLARKDYGELNPAVSRLSEELDSSVPFGHALRNLADRLSGTHAYHVMHNASEGGDLQEAGARLRELEAMEKDFALKSQSYTLAFYSLFLLFAAVATFMGKAYGLGGLPLQLICIQALFAGIATGKIAENSFSAGAKHALAFLIIGSAAYAILSGI